MAHLEFTVHSYLLHEHQLCEHLEGRDKDHDCMFPIINQAGSGLQLAS